MLFSRPKRDPAPADSGGGRCCRGWSFKFARVRRGRAEAGKVKRSLILKQLGRTSADVQVSEGREGAQLSWQGAGQAAAQCDVSVVRRGRGQLEVDYRRVASVAAKGGRMGRESTATH